MPGEKFSPQTEGNHIGNGLGEKAGDEDQRTRNLKALWKESTNGNYGAKKSCGSSTGAQTSELVVVMMQRSYEGREDEAEE